MRRSLLPRCVLLRTLLAIFVLSTSVLAQSSVLIPARTDLGELLRRGQQMETEHRWGEALSHYEDALRQIPGEGSLKRHFDLARLHYELIRRSNDRSQRELLSRFSRSESVELYNEVLTKIQAHYVDTPRWKDLVEAGVQAIEVALSEPAFLHACSLEISPENFQRFSQELRGTLEARMIQTRADARDAVALAASLAEQRLGVAAGIAAMEFTCGAVVSLDPYCTYLTPDQLNEVYSQIEGNFVGLGVELKTQDKSLVIVRVIPHSPAKRAGIVDGDRIVAVNRQPVANISADLAANLLQGPPGSQVELTLVAPAGQPRQVLVMRERVEVPSVDQTQILAGTQGVGYLKLTCFQKTTYRDLEAALWDLHRAGMQSLIVDLRGNPGGLLVASVEAADLFIDQGVIVSTHGRNRQEDFTYSAREPGTWRVPLVVLIDQDSASAAEIFAGAIRDHRRGTVIGQRSYGKGSVQGIFPLNSGNTGLRLTTAKFYSPTGYAYSGVGVEPHVVIPKSIVHQVAMPAADLTPPQTTSPDPALATAAQTAQQLMAKR